MQRQFTATVYLIEDDKLLLVHHKKYGTWMPPGGHLEENETPDEAAVREAFEEAGVEVELIGDEVVQTSSPIARRLVRPLLCQIEDIAARADHPAHQHIDLIYLARLKQGSISPSQREVHDARWFSWSEIEALPSDLIFCDVRQTARYLLVERFEKS